VPSLFLETEARLRSECPNSAVLGVAREVYFFPTGPPDPNLAEVLKKIRASRSKFFQVADQIVLAWVLYAEVSVNCRRISI